MHVAFACRLDRFVTAGRVVFTNCFLATIAEDDIISQGISPILTAEAVSNCLTCILGASPFEM